MSIPKKIQFTEEDLEDLRSAISFAAKSYEKLRGPAPNFLKALGAIDKKLCHAIRQHTLIAKPPGWKKRYLLALLGALAVLSLGGCGKVPGTSSPATALPISQPTAQPLSSPLVLAPAPVTGVNVTVCGFPFIESGGSVYYGFDYVLPDTNGRLIVPDGQYWANGCVYQVLDGTITQTPGGSS